MNTTMNHYVLSSVSREEARTSVGGNWVTPDSGSSFIDCEEAHRVQLACPLKQAVHSVHQWYVSSSTSEVKREERQLLASYDSRREVISVEEEGW